MAVKKKRGRKKASKKTARKKATKKATKKTARKKAKKRSKKKAGKKAAGKKVSRKKTARNKSAKQPVAKRAKKKTAKKESAGKPTAKKAAKKKSTNAGSRIHVAPNLFAETADGPRLLGSRCLTCGTPYFPKADLCRNPECRDSRLEDAAFGPRAKLWSCAVQNYPPPSPTRFDPPYEPYALGVVDTEEGLRVVSRILTNDPASIEPNMDLELVIEPFCHDDDGNAVVTWMFRPL